MNIAGIFDKVSAQMRLDLEKAREALTHAGLKGYSAEKTFRAFLRNYLPRSLDVCTGQLIDSNGRISCQLDIIICDGAKTPIFYESGDTRVIPVECVYSIIEVKTMLDGGELERTFNNMESVRSLQKTAYFKHKGNITYNTTLYGRKWEIWPVNYFVFAYDSISLANLEQQIQKKHQIQNWPEHSKIDTVCVLDKGIICNRLKDGKFSALPEPGSELFVCETAQSLLLFYALTSVYFNQANLPNFNFTNYIKHVTFGPQKPNLEDIEEPVQREIIQLLKENQPLTVQYLMQKLSQSFSEDNIVLQLIKMRHLGVCPSKVSE